MRPQQSGFTLVEIAIVLVIIGLLLGGILKGQELINSAKVKNLANDFRVIPTYVYAYQDKFRSLPGDDSTAASHVTCAAPCQNGNGNGVINGNWDSVTVTDESWQFWGHVRAANLTSGSTTWTAAATSDPYVPKNAVGGQLGINSAVTTQLQVTGMAGTYQVCSAGVLGKFAIQLDIQMDDGNTGTGSLRAVPDGSPKPTPGVQTSAIDPAANYTVCMTF